MQIECLCFDKRDPICLVERISTLYSRGVLYDDDKECMADVFVCGAFAKETLVT